MRELIDAFFRERSIVNHHIASFNDFLPTIDNPNSRMQRIVDNLRSSPEDDRRGVIKLDEDRTEGDVIEITSPSVRSSSSLMTPRRSSSGEDLRLSTIRCILEFGLSIVGRKSLNDAI